MEGADWLVPLRSRRRGLDADGAAADAGHEGAALECVRRRFPELVALFDGGEPEREGGGEGAASPLSVALYERRRPERFQTRTRGHQGLPAPFCSRVGVLKTDLFVMK